MERMFYPKGVDWVQRPTLVRQLRETLINQRQCLLNGPAFFGKSLLARDLLRQDPAITQRFAHILEFDFFTLPMDHAMPLERGLLRRLYDGDEQKFIAFINKLDDLPGKRKRPPLPLDAFLEEKREDGELLLILDQVEVMSQSREIKKWLQDFRNKWQNRDGVSLLWLERLGSVEESRLANELPPALEMSPLTREEIASWLEQPFFSELKQYPDAAEQVHQATGGMASLTSDFARYWEGTSNKNIESIESFVKGQSQHYSRSRHLIFQALRDFPEEIDTWQNYPSQALQRRLMASGAFTRNEDGFIQISSSIHASKIERLVTRDNLLKIAAHRDIEWILAKKKSKEHWDLELLLEPLNHYLLGTSKHQDVLKNVSRFIEKFFHIRISFFVRDNMYPQVWHELICDGVYQKRIHLLQTHDELRESLHYGKMSVQNGKIYFPVTTPPGSVDLIVTGVSSRKRETSSWRSLLVMRAVWRALQTMGDILARNVEAYWLSYYRGKSLKQYYHVDKTLYSTQPTPLRAFLDETKATAVALMNVANSAKGTWKDWTTVISEDIKGGLFQRVLRGPIVSISFNEGNDLFSDSGIANERIMLPDVGKRCMPSLYHDNCVPTLFLRVIGEREDKNTSWLAVLFIFLSPDGSDRPVILDGFQQQRLSILSQRIIHTELVQRRVRQEYLKETSLLEHIGAIMPMAMVDPEEAQRRILEEIKGYFHVKVISLSDVVTVTRRGKDHREVHLRHSLGYLQGYSEKIYDVDKEPHGEGKTGYIAHKGDTITTYKSSDGNKLGYVLQENEGRPILIPLQVDFVARDQCGPYTADGDVLAFVGAPIFWRHGDSDEQVMGLLKLANREETTPQPWFDAHEAASVRRIARLLAPLLHLLQYGSRYGAERRLKSMAAMFRGIGHEFRTPMVRIRNSVQLMEQAEKMGRMDIVLQEGWSISEDVTLLDDILDTLKKIAVHDPGSPACLPLSDCITDTWNKMAAPETVTLKTMIPDHVTVTIDYSQFIRALENLFRNAIEALAGQEDGQVEVLAEQKMSMIVFTIRDNGPGIPKYLKDRVFDPFVTGNKTMVREGDPNRYRGIGLTIVRETLESAGGSIELLPTVKGAAFEIKLPFC